MTTSLSPYQCRPCDWVSGEVVAHLLNRSCCCSSWWARTHSSIADSLLAHENRQERVVDWTNSFGGRTVIATLSCSPLS